MFSKPTSAVLVAFAAATAAFAAKLDVFDPTIITPTTGTTWTVGTSVNVTWDTSNAPSSITSDGKVTLAKGGTQFSSGTGSYSDPLASGFDLRQGWVTVTVPDVDAADDYEIVLFGDSGNISNDFTIADA